MERHNTKRIIRGSGGKGGGSSSGGHVADDTLQSTAFVQFIDVLCEGEIVGLVNGKKSVYFDKTPLEDSSGNDNFHLSGDPQFRYGTQAQDYVAGFSSASNEISVNTEIKYGSDGAIIRQITNPNADRLTATFLIPSLTKTDTSNGNVTGSSVAVSVWVKPYGGSYTQVASKSINNQKSSGNYQFTLNVPLSGGGPYSVSFQRDTADATNMYEQNKTYLSYYAEVSDAKLTYPNTAYVALALDAKQFSSIPSRIYEVDLLKIHIPSNYDDVTRAYTGSWDGTFKLSTGACNNPAWVFYDLLTSTRYGLGKYLSASQIDKWALYTIAQYCDELVPDGFGGTEPRFTCNILIQSRDQAYNILQGLSSIFRGMIYWGAGSVTATQDSPKDAALLFTNANVVDGIFTYQGASATARHSVALVSWNDPANFCEPSVEYVEDTQAIASFGVQETSVYALGCTSRGQAHRFGKWLLYTERVESETIVFKTGLDGMVAVPGQVIKVADDARAGIRLGGRISTATTSSVTVDKDLTGSLAGASLSVLLPDGTIEDRPVTGYVGRVISVSPNFSSAANTQSVWILKLADVEPQTFRVISVAEDDGTYVFTALRHDPDKFAEIEQNIVFEPKNYSVLTAAPSTPQNLQIIETLYQSGSSVKSKFTIACDNVPGAVGYVFSYKYDTGNTIDLPETSYNEVEVLDASIGAITAYAYAVGPTGAISPTATATTQLYGKTSAPHDVTGFSMLPSGGLAYLSWDRSIDLDVLIGGFVRIRHTPNITDQLWKDGVDIVPALAGTANSAAVPLLEGTYMIKFVDSSGNFSDNAETIVTTVPEADALNVVETIQEDPTFNGTLTNMVFDASKNAIVLGSSTLIDDIPLIDDWGNLDYSGDIVAFGTYDFQNVVDLGGVWPTNIIREIDLEAFDIGNLIDQRTTPIDEWVDIDGEIINDVNAELFMQTTSDDPSGSPTWSDWKSVSNASYTARGFKFQLRCTSGNASHNLWIKKLKVTLDVDDRVENLGPLTSGAGSYNVTYSYPFYQNPAIGITATNLQSGDYWQITSETASGFSIIFKNAAGTAINRTFYVMAKGFGRKVA